MMQELSKIFNEASKEEYMIKCAIEDVRLNGFAQILLSEGNGVGPYALQALQEDVGDKIKALYNKFIAMITNLYSKFASFISKKISDNTAWLEKNKDILFNKTTTQNVGNTDITLDDYTKGIERYMKIKIMNFSEAMPHLENNNPLGLQQKYIPEYRDANQDFTQFAVSYFSGEDNRKSYKLNALNVTDMYNFCHDFSSKIQPTIQQDIKTLENTKSQLSSVINTAKQAAASQKAQAAAPANQAPASNSTPAAKPAPAKQTANNASADLMSNRFLDNFFNEDSSRIIRESAYYLEAGVDIGSTPANGGTAQQTADKSNNGAAIAAATNTSNPTQPGSVKTNINPTETPANKQIDVNGATEQDLKNKEDMLTTYFTVSTSVLKGKLQAATNINSGYMKILRFIVSSISGNANSPGDTEVKNQTNYNQQQAPAAQPAQQPAQQASAAQA